MDVCFWSFYHMLLCSLLRCPQSQLVEVNAVSLFGKRFSESDKLMSIHLFHCSSSKAF